MVQGGCAYGVLSPGVACLAEKSRKKRRCPLFFKVTKTDVSCALRSGGPGRPDRVRRRVRRRSAAARSAAGSAAGSTERQTRVRSVLIRASRGPRQHLRHPPPAQSHKAGGRRARYMRRTSHRTHPDTPVNRPYLTPTDADSDALWSSVTTGPGRFISSTAWPMGTLLSCSDLSIPKNPD